jgi:hypothetical protein
VTTLAALAARALNAMGDTLAETWSSSQVEEWLLEGIADYSQYFPRQLEAALTTSAGVRAYDLPAALETILLVEYPTGKEPPIYLTRRSRARRDFWTGAGYYDWEAVGDATGTPRLYLAEQPLDGETITVTYLARHDTALASEGAVTVPVPHEHILLLYAVLMAWQERLAQEERAPTSNSTLLLSQFATNADRARRNYVQAIARARIAGAGRASRVQWPMDKWEAR